MFTYKELFCQARKSKKKYYNKTNSTNYEKNYINLLCCVILFIREARIMFDKNVTFKQITEGPLIKWTGDKHVEFGSYPQAQDGGVRKILWRVLENKDGQLLLLSEYIPKKMNKMNINRLTDDTYASYEERGCRDTQDKVFLLNVEESIKYFPKSESVPETVWIWNNERKTKATDYILKRGIITDHPDYRNIKCSLIPNKGWTSGKGVRPVVLVNNA